MPTKYQKIHNLKVSEDLFSFVNDELLKSTDISSDKFWLGFDKAVHELSPINKKLIKKRDDFQKKIDRNVKSSIFRGNICIDGIEPWVEREWIGKIIEINNVSFKVEKNIPRCVAINLKPQTDDNSFNLLQSLKKTYNHFEMGIYLTVLNDGKINIGDTINI